MFKHAAYTTVFILTAVGATAIQASHSKQASQAAERALHAVLAAELGANNNRYRKPITVITTKPGQPNPQTGSRAATKFGKHKHR